MPIDPATQAGVHSDRETTDAERQEGGVNLAARSPTGRTPQVGALLFPNYRWLEAYIDANWRAWAVAGCKVDKARNVVTDQHGNRLYLFHGNQEPHTVRGLVFDKSEVKGPIDTERCFVLWEEIKLLTRPRS